MANAPERDKEKLKLLYSEEREGTEDLYSDIGYFMWMRCWIAIHSEAVVDKIRSVRTLDESKVFFDYFMEMMSRYIGDKKKTSSENINNMICNRDQIKSKFSNNPEKFVEKMRLCLQREQELLQRYSQGVLQMERSSIDEVDTEDDQQMSVSVSLNAEENDEDLSMDEDDTLGLDSFDSSIQFDAGFMDGLEETFREMEKFFRTKEELKDEYEEKNRAVQVVDRREHFNVLQQMANIEQRKKEPEKRYEATKTQLLKMLKDSLKNLEDIRDQYRQLQTLMDPEVKLQPWDEMASITMIFDRFAKILKKLFSEFGGPPRGLDEIIASYIDLAAVVLEHPDAYIFIENEDKKEKKGEETEAKDGKLKTAKGKEPKIFATKKRQSISTKIRILGGQYLRDFFVKDHRVEMRTDDDHKCAQLSHPTFEVKECVLAFSNIKIQDYIRQGSASVRYHLVRLCFNLKVSCFDREFEIMTKSLPFHLCTGAIQGLELIGTRMWHFGSNSTSMYSSARLSDNLEADIVLDILDKRIKNVGECRGRGRALSKDGRQFLKDMLKRGDSSGNTKISLHSFVKGSSKKKTDPTKFSFFTWFYALVNSIETYLLKPWQDGVIYDLLSKDQAEQILLNESVPLHTALIRPVTSSVLQPNCKDATIKIAVEIKLRIGDEIKVSVVTADMTEVSGNSLSGILQRIKDSEGFPVISYVLTTRRVVPLEELKFERSKAPCQEYHGSMVERVANLQLRNTNEPSTHPQTKKPRDYQHDLQPRRRKSARASSLTSMSSSNSPMGISSPYSSTGPNGGSPMMQPDGLSDVHKNDMRSPGVMSSGSDMGFSELQLQRLNSCESKEIKDEIVDNAIQPIYVDRNSQPIYIDENSQSPNSAKDWIECGSVQVDVSKIPPELLANGETSVTHNAPDFSNQMAPPTSIPNQPCGPLTMNGYDSNPGDFQYGNGLPNGFPRNGLQSDSSGLEMVNGLSGPNTNEQFIVLPSNLNDLTGNPQLTNSDITDILEGLNGFEEF